MSNQDLEAKGFEVYKTKQVRVPAICITDPKMVMSEEGSTTKRLISDNGNITFQATQQIEKGDYIIHQSPDDIYHCPRAVFIEKYFMEPPGSGAKTMGNVDRESEAETVDDVKVFGKELFKLMSKASSKKEGWMKSTKCMMVGDTAVIQVTTQQGRNVAEAVHSITGVVLVEEQDEKGKVTGRHLEPKPTK